MFKIILVSILLPASAMAYYFPYTGDGSDGVCTSASLTPTTRTEYNCTTLYINGDVTLDPSSTLTIRVQEGIVISNKLTISPGTAGGHVQGSEPFPNTAGKNAIDASGPALGGGSGGSGGGGGSYNGHFPGQVGATSILIDGSDTQQSIPGQPGSSFYGFERFFETVMYGGAPGGNGGASSTGDSGGIGGSGGGTLRIISGDNIVIDAGGIIEVKGANGSIGVGTHGGGGGGGTGGAIFLQAFNNISIEGLITAQGGPGGAGAASNTSGVGGTGGHGRLRLDDIDGMIDGSQSQNTIPYGVRKSYRDKEQIYKELSTCGTIQTESDGTKSFLISLILGILASCIIYRRKKSSTNS